MRRDRRRAVLALAVLALSGVRAAAAAAGGGTASLSARLARAGPFPVLQLADGRTLVVVGIVVPTDQPALLEQAGGLIADWLAAAPLLMPDLATAIPDRHGRLPVSPAHADGSGLAAELARAGAAIVAPTLGLDPVRLASLLAVEAEARAASRGLWASAAYGVLDADRVPPIFARYVLVEGRIVRIARTSLYWYANFSRSIRRDFTFRIPIAVEGRFTAAGLDLAGLGERLVRVRGWLFEDNGPMIEVTHPLALELRP